PLPGSSRTATSAPSSPGGTPPSLVHPYVRRPPRSWTSPVRWLPRRRSAPDDSPAASPATTAGEGRLGSGRRCGSACSHHQRTRLRTFPYKNVPLCSSPGPPERIYLRQTPSGFVQTRQGPLIGSAPVCRRRPMRQQQQYRRPAIICIGRCCSCQCCRLTWRRRRTERPHLAISHYSAMPRRPIISSCTLMPIPQSAVRAAPRKVGSLRAPLAVLD